MPVNCGAARCSYRADSVKSWPKYLPRNSEVTAIDSATAQHVWGHDPLLKEADRLHKPGF